MYEELEVSTHVGNMLLAGKDFVHTNNINVHTKNINVHPKNINVYTQPMFKNWSVDWKFEP